MHTRASARSERRQSGVFAQSFLRHLREGETRDSAKCSRITATTLQPPGPLECSRPALALCNASSSSSLAFAFTGRSGRRGLVLHDLLLGLVRGLLRLAEVAVRAFLRFDCRGTPHERPRGKARPRARRAPTLSSSRPSYRRFLRTQTEVSLVKHERSRGSRGLCAQAPR